MKRHKVVIHLLGEPYEKADPCLRALLAQGFAADRMPLHLEAVPVAGVNDIFVLTGISDPRIHTPENVARFVGDKRERTILFLTGMSRPAFVAFEQAGYPFINLTSDATVTGLIGLIAQIDPAAVYHASKAVALRTSMSNRIANSVVDLFSRLRANPVAPTLKESARQRRAMDELISSSPMSVWIDLIQGYHDGTAQHCSLVSGYTLAFARTLGLGEKQTERLFDAAFFHDVGKAKIPLTILDKPGRLEPDEWEIMKRHVLHSYDILSRDEHTAGEIARVARDHHEYLDGSGYPNGIRGNEIDDITRIITICDIFAALTERRAYKPPKPFDEAYSILASMAGTKLDPDLVQLFARVADQSDALSCRYESAA